MEHQIVHVGYKLDCFSLALEIVIETLCFAETSYLKDC